MRRINLNTAQPMDTRCNINSRITYSEERSVI